MARIRTIKPEFFKHEDLCKLPEVTHYGMAAGLLTYADDEGYFNANPALIKGELFALRDTSVTIHGMLTELSNVGYLRLGSTPDGKRYGHIIGFSKHQVVNRGKGSRIKTLPIVWDESVTNHGTITDPSSLEWKGREGNISSAETPTRKKVSRVTDPDWWLDFKLAYPHRAGDQGWRKAQKAAHARQSEGHTPEEFIAGALRYATYCEAIGNAGTQFVKQASTFLGPDKPFAQPWEVPPPAPKPNGRDPYQGAI